jgi:hypothetical protein
MQTVLDAVRALRTRLGQTQQVFAERTLNIAMSTAVRYELSRPPRGRMLVKLLKLAESSGFPEQADVFRKALNRDLGAEHLVIASHQGAHFRGRYENPRGRVHPWEQFLAVSDRFIRDIQRRKGCSFTGISMAPPITSGATAIAFHSSDGTSYIAEFAGPEI